MNSVFCFTVVNSAYHKPFRRLNVLQRHSSISCYLSYSGRTVLMSIPSSTFFPSLVKINWTDVTSNQEFHPCATYCHLVHTDNKCNRYYSGTFGRTDCHIHWLALFDLQICRHPQRKSDRFSPDFHKVSEWYRSRGCDWKQCFAYG